MHARSIVAGALMAAAIGLPAGVTARPRPRFEPTDLEWESTGVFEVDELEMVGPLVFEVEMEGAQSFRLRLVSACRKSYGRSTFRNCTTVCRSTSVRLLPKIIH